jgi:DNA-binding LytR/AlgR family response regulator
MPLAKREWSSLLWRHGVAAVGLGLLLGFLGPFGSYPAFGRIERYAFWLGLGLTGYACGFLAWKLLGKAPPLAQQPAPAAFIAGLLSAVPQTFMVFWAMSLLQPDQTASVAALVALFAAVTAIQLILLTAIVLIDRTLPPAADTKDTRALPQTVRNEYRLLALEAQDHYVRVHEMHGSKLVLKRLSDAVVEVSDVEGIQVHRGWWVANAAVAGTFVENGKRWVRLVNGMTIPVSRARRRDVLARGWPTLQPSRTVPTSR